MPGSSAVMFSTAPLLEEVTTISNPVSRGSSRDTVRG